MMDDLKYAVVGLIETLNEMVITMDNAADRIGALEDRVVALEADRAVLVEEER